MKKDENDESYNCTKMFLKFLNFPTDDTAEIDLKQAAVLLLAHLDRLALPHLPSQLFSKANVCILTYLRALS